MTIFRKNSILLGIGALALSAAFVIAAIFLLDHQYSKTNSSALLEAAKAFVVAAGEDRINDALNGTVIDSDLFDYLAAICSEGNYRITLISSDGNILWDSAGMARANHLSRSEVQTTLEGGEGLALRNSITTKTRQIYAAVPVNNSGGVAGVFRISVVIPGFWERIAPSALPLFICAVLFILAAFAGIMIFSRSQAESLKHLVAIAETAAYAETGADTEHRRNNDAGIAVPGETEEYIVLETALQHITKELKWRKEQANTEDRQFLAILNGMSGAVLAMDNNLTLYLANLRARSLFNLENANGIAAGKTNGNGMAAGFSLLAATRSTELEQIARTVLEEGSPLEMKLKLTNNGEGRKEQLFHVFATPISAPAGVIIVMEDITRLARLEQMRKDFVANVSHELRTPIQLIKGFSEALLDTPDGNTEQFNRGIEIIRKNAWRMENLTNDLLALASLEDSDSGFDMEEQHLAPLFAEAVQSVEPQAKTREMKIIVNCPDDLTATVHGSFIIQALINLLDNGIKYSRKKKRVWASAYRENGNLVLEVKDEGIGIPVEHLKRIFERFYRVDRAHSRETGGTGLGLSIVRHIALLHKGTAEVESHANEGSVFRIRIGG